MGKKLADKYFPILATFFIFIIVSNYSGLLPGAGHFSGFKVPTANLSVTASLALIGFFMIHTVGVKERGVGGYLKSFLSVMLALRPRARAAAIAIRPLVIPIVLSPF